MSPRRLMAAGALLTVVGIAVAGTAPVFGTGADDRMRAQQTAGGVAILLGWVTLGWGTHRLGRQGKRAG